MPPSREHRSAPTKSRRTDGRLTSRDIAEVAGVSQATVSNVINRPDMVAPETLDRVRAVMDELGFVLNTAARNLRTGRTQTLGMVALDLANPFWGEVVRGVESAASERNYSVLLGASEESADKEREFLRLFEEHRVDGVLVSSIDLQSDAIAALRERGTKVVLLDQRDPFGTHPSVAFDHVEGAALVADHLIEHGHRRIGMLNGPHTLPWCQDRIDGLRLGVARGGLDPTQVVQEFAIRAMTGEDAEPAIDAVIDSGVTALFCVNDLVALGALKSLSRRRIPVPGRLSIVGFDDSIFSSMLSPALTTVRQQPYAMGRSAARLVIDEIEGNAPAPKVFHPELVVRESVSRL
jgi:LacI family transcriptional regulator